jgi:hypothetical protein
MAPALIIGMSPIVKGLPDVAFNITFAFLFDSKLSIKL